MLDPTCLGTPTASGILNETLLTNSSTRVLILGKIRCRFYLDAKRPQSHPCLLPWPPFSRDLPSSPRFSCGLSPAQRAFGQWWTLPGVGAKAPGRALLLWRHTQRTWLACGGYKFPSVFAPTVSWQSVHGCVSSGAPRLAPRTLRWEQACWKSTVSFLLSANGVRPPGGLVGVGEGRRVNGAAWRGSCVSGQLSPVLGSQGCHAAVFCLK